MYDQSVKLAHVELSVSSREEQSDNKPRAEAKLIVKNN